MPGAYSDEFNMKLEFQQRAMEAKLVELGYRQIMAECRELHEAIVDANPAFSRLGDAERAAHGRAAWNQCFGALQKYSNGVGVIMAFVLHARVLRVRVASRTDCDQPPGWQSGRVLVLLIP